MQGEAELDKWHVGSLLYGEDCIRVLATGGRWTWACGARATYRAASPPRWCGAWRVTSTACRARCGRCSARCDHDCAMCKTPPSPAANGRRDGVDAVTPTGFGQIPAALARGLPVDLRSSTVDAGSSAVQRRSCGKLPSQQRSTPGHIRSTLGQMRSTARQRQRTAGAIPRTPGVIQVSPGTIQATPGQRRVRPKQRQPTPSA